MDNVRIYDEIRRLRTSDLLIRKMLITQRLSRFKAMKMAVLGVLGLITGQVAKTFFESGVAGFGYVEGIGLVLAVIAAIAYLTFNNFESGLLAQKDLIADLLALRASRAGTGRKSSKSAKLK